MPPPKLSHLMLVLQNRRDFLMWTLAEKESRILLGSSEFDRVLGGGMVKGSMVLLAGEPGIGKSTLSLHKSLTCNDLKTLYVSGEESARQIVFKSGET